MKRKIRNLALLTSGDGTIIQAIINSVMAGDMDAEINIVISDRENTLALTRATMFGIKTYVLKARTIEERDEEMLQILEKSNVELVVLAEYLKSIGPKVIEQFTLINTYPTLLPKYSGKGMYGIKVHREVVANHERKSGATVHFVNEEYGKGQIIYQTPIPVYSEDTPEDVKSRVQAMEKTQLVTILKAFTQGKIDIPKNNKGS